MTPSDFSTKVLTDACDSIIKNKIGKRCVVCKKKFKPHLPKQKTCSHKCRGKKAVGRLVKWTPENVKLLKKHYHDTGTEVLRDLMPHKTLVQIRKKARHLGLRCTFEDLNPVEIMARIAEIRMEKERHVSLKFEGKRNCLDIY